MLFACYCVIGLVSECIGSPFGPHFCEKDGNKKTEKKIRLEKLEYLGQ